MVKIKNNCLNKMSRYIIGSFFLTIGVSIIVIPKILKMNYLIQEDRKVEEFMNNQNDDLNSEDLNLESNSSDVTSNVQNEILDYIAVIEIPKINLKKGIYPKDSYLNSINNGIEILKEAEYPEIPNSNFILASHSGSSYISYFKDLDKISIEDEIFIFYKKIQYKYRVVNKYEVDKTGKASIIRNFDKRTLTLITCKKNYDKQIIFICEEI